jgi:hypothetical protein
VMSDFLSRHAKVPAYLDGNLSAQSDGTHRAKGRSQIATYRVSRSKSVQSHSKKRGHPYLAAFQFHIYPQTRLLLCQFRPIVA